MPEEEFLPAKRAKSYRYDEASGCAPAYYGVPEINPYQLHESDGFNLLAMFSKEVKSSLLITKDNYY